MDFAAARHNMVESQVKPNRVTNPKILDAIADLPREKFVPQGLEGVAYVDEALAMGDGRYMMEAMILGRLLQEADTTGEDIALVVGCGSGYEAAVLSRLAGTVVALEDDKAAADQANAKLLEQASIRSPWSKAPWPKAIPANSPMTLFSSMARSVKYPPPCRHSWPKAADWLPLSALVRLARRR